MRDLCRIPFTTELITKRLLFPKADVPLFAAVQTEAKVLVEATSAAVTITTKPILSLYLFLLSAFIPLLFSVVSPLGECKSLPFWLQPRLP